MLFRSPLRFPAAAIRPPGRGLRPYQDGTLRCARNALPSRMPPMRYRPVILAAVLLSRRVNLLYKNLLSEKWHKKSRKPFKDFLLGGAAGGRLVFSFESSGQVGPMMMRGAIFDLVFF